MTKGEREDLQRLIRQREKALKSAAKQRSTELLAEFENQLAARCRFDQDETWAEAVRIAEGEVVKANDRIAARCAELGIPKDFAPSLNFSSEIQRHSMPAKTGKFATPLLEIIAQMGDGTELRRSIPGRHPGRLALPPIGLSQASSRSQRTPRSPWSGRAD
jgi:hypothetical protein